MHLWTLMLGLMMAGSAWASRPEFNVKAELLLNGQVVAAPRINARAGRTARVSSSMGSSGDRVRFAVTPSMSSEVGDELVLDIDLELRRGDRIIKSSPQVIARAGSEATLLLEESTKQEKLQLRILAKPVAR
ncbi:MAG: hypothetical protein AB7F86_17395 [Bdellovibrionales bacterium]